MLFFKKKNKTSYNLKELPIPPIDSVEEKESQERTQERTSDKDSEETREQTGIAINNKSYFYDLLNTISREIELLEGNENCSKKINFNEEDVIHKDLIKGMKENWKKQRGNIMFAHKKDKLKNNIFERVSKLQAMEEEWQSHHLKLIEKEENIRKEEEQLKDVLKELREFCVRHIEEENKEENKKENKEKRCEDVKPEHYFYLNNGSIIKNLFDLTNTLKSIDEGTFKYHVNENKNDFANWIRDVIKDDRLAGSISKSNSKEEIIRILN